jgi:hypothetical protein
MASSANSYLQVTELDFEDIRTNLKSYLSTQTQFQDYDFEGSAMAVLLDVLAYNTHYNAYYLNMLANESFLDTAQQRDSVVSFAKALGYVPTSAIGASATINVQFNGVTANTAQFTIPKNSKFSTTIDDVQYTFVTTESHTVVNQSGVYSKEISIREGTPLTHRFTVDSNNPQRYIIPNKNIDISSIVINVQESAVDTTTTEFTRATNINQIFSTTPVYFIEEVANERYEIIFGSGSLGKAVKNGNIIIIDYLVNNADETNGANAFSVDDLNVGVNYNSVTLTTVESARGGTTNESIDSIKFNAPRNFQTQNRAVIDKDYERILLSENSDVESIIAFGGEQRTPPVYGKVLIAVKPFGEKFATESRKTQLKESISTRTPLGIDPLMIDPEYIYIIPTIKTYFNATTTTATRGQVEQAIKDAIDSYSTNNLERFGNKFRYSRFVRVLDNVAVADILNNDASIQIQKRIIPSLGGAQNIIINFNNQLRRSTLDSTQFTYSGFPAYLDDNGSGTVRIYRFDTNKNKVIIIPSIGTIDYATGTIELSSFAPSAFVDAEIKITATPDALDVTPIREQILIMESVDATVSAIGEYE